MHTSDVTPISGSVGPGVILAALNLRSMNTPAPAPHGDDLSHLGLIRDLGAISLTQFSNGFQGKSSGAMLVRAAIELRERYEGKDLPWSSRRIHYWTYNPAKHQVPHVGPFLFPDPDLLSTLIDLYFARRNLYFPILHRPTFERSIADGLHTRDITFGSVVLLVCAIASRDSEDIRLQQETEPFRRGWQFFDQVPPHSNHIFETPTIYHLQYYCLAAWFLEFSCPSASWALIGFGLRLAQDVGAHRQREGQPTVESELWKRAFWALVSFDRQISMANGRTCTSQYEDIDADLLIECDDEFWENEDPARAFIQPVVKPALSSFFNCYLRLNNIFAVGLKMLYSLNKTKRLLSYRDQAWEEHIVAELDSVLNSWIDQIPPHLRWDPTRPEDAFFDQSAFLYCSYYQVQMTIHRPFIPMMRNAVPTSLPSLASVPTLRGRAVMLPKLRDSVKTVLLSPNSLFPSVFTSGVILLLNVWSGKRTGLPPHMNSALTEVHKCMATMRVCEKLLAGGSLQVFATIFCTSSPQLGSYRCQKDVTPPDSAPSNPSKRARENDDEVRVPPTSAPAVAHPPTGNIYHPTHFDSAPAVNTPPIGHQFSPLPTYTTDLGKMPVFQQSPTPPLESMSSWYPTQSATPFGRPDFATGVQLPDGGADNVFNMDHLFTSDVGIAGASNHALATDGMSSDVQAMWVNAPTNFELEDWGQYFLAMSDLSQTSGTPLR
ncbi:Zn(2)-C6 fungal-type domain-containing protein [Mycena sanguinolenta]|uniref:Zn(2)-C6 fungal-type domain-containing protein n=1 Tax=Mycena sanguinolenta TaxID=230812 RepID=A0A8H6Y6S9_9AGAR|nr:Zn(2)-C6 fungal-type domain-containing protein [Mycena sanguinolenta]